jgi:hypothetical protein
MKRLFLLLILFLALAQTMSEQSTVLTNSTVLTKTTKLGLTIPVLRGWTIVQDTIATSCTSTTSCSFAPCTGGAGTECIAPTVSGSVWIVSVVTTNNVHISSVTGGGGTWSLCPSNNCNNYNSSFGTNSDLAYNLSGSSGTQAITVNLSSTSSSLFLIGFIEALPPPGYTAAYDTSGTHTDTTCVTSPCSGVPLTLSATDFVYQCCELNLNPWETLNGNAWSSPYLTSLTGNGLGLNVPSGLTSPIISIRSNTGTGFASSAIAFKSTAGIFTSSSSTNFSLVQYALPTNTGPALAGQVGCSPACPALNAFNSTGLGNLLVLVEGDTGASGYRLSSISDNKSQTCTIPTGANTCGANAALSCAYVLSSTSGVTSIKPTLTGTTTTAGFSLWEFHRATGTWTLDTQGAMANTVTTLPVSPTVTCTGTNDVVITAIAAHGGVSGAQYMAVGFFPEAGLNLLSASPYEPSNGVLFNTTNCGPFTFPYENTASASPNSFTVAFR